MGPTRGRKPSFYEAHPTLTLYTPDAEYSYEIFSVDVTAADVPALPPIDPARR